MRTKHGKSTVLVALALSASAAVGLGATAAAADSPPTNLASVSTQWGPGDYTLAFGGNSAYCAAGFTLYARTDQLGRTSTVAAVIETPPGTPFELRVGDTSYLRAAGGTPGFATGLTQIAGSMTGRVAITDQMPPSVRAGLPGVALASIGDCPLQTSTAPVAPAGLAKPTRFTREAPAPHLGDPGRLIATAIRAGDRCWPTVSRWSAGLGGVALCGGAPATSAWTVDATGDATPAIWFAQSRIIGAATCSFVFGGQRGSETWVSTIAPAPTLTADIVAAFKRTSRSTFFLQPVSPSC